MSTPYEAIAIVGMALRLPGAMTPKEYWDNLVAGRESISDLTDEQLLLAGVPRSEFEREDYVRRNPLMPMVAEFDAPFFGYTRREAEVMDPQQRVFLETAYSAVEDAGYAPRAMTGVVGVFAGGATNGYAEYNVRGNPELSRRVGVLATATSNHLDYLATSVAYKLGYTGPTLTVATACSTSMVAVHLACAALRSGECDVALAGGVALEVPYGAGYRWSPGSIVSRDGYCRPFDADAAGTVFGNGAGVIVLKRLSDAQQDHDDVRALVLATAIGNDGSGKLSFGAPSVQGQAQVVAEAMALAGVRPENVSYVEAHGTGTTVGDPLELEALERTFEHFADHPLLPGTIPIGSAKSGVGHMGAAAGVTSIIKTALCMQHQTIAPSINIRRPNPRLNLAESPFRLATEAIDWPATGRRVAGVSSFGVGGTNAHAVLEAAPPVNLPDNDAVARLLVWSGHNQQALDDYALPLAMALDAAGPSRLGDVAATLAVSRTAHPLRAALVATSVDDAVSSLRGQGPRTVIRGSSVDEIAEVTFLFPGQGAQQARMARGLYGYDKAFTQDLDRSFEVLAGEGVDLRQTWWEQDSVTELADTVLAQPLLFAVEHALAVAWETSGVHAGALLGHSVGELVAASLAGVLSAEDAARVVAARGRLMQELPRGSMLAVQSPVSALDEVLAEGHIDLAAVNSSEQVVLAGPDGALTDVQSRLAVAGVVSQLLPTSHAFHSRAMHPAVEPFRAVLEAMPLAAPNRRIISAATGREVTSAQAQSPEFWARQLTEPVRFAEALDTLLVEGRHVLLEVGPGTTLTSLARKHPAMLAGLSFAVASSPRQRQQDADDRASMLDARARLWVGGLDSALPTTMPEHRVALPTYAFQRQHHWVTPTQGAARPLTEVTPEQVSSRLGGSSPATAAAASTTTTNGPTAPTANVGVAPGGTTSTTPSAALHVGARPLQGATFSDGAFSELVWREIRSLPLSGRGRGRVAWVLAPDDATARKNVLRWLRAAGYDTQVAGSTDEIRDLLAGPTPYGQESVVVVHARSLSRFDQVTSRNMEEQLEASFFSLFSLTRTLQRQPLPVALLVLTQGAIDITGGELLEPVKATALGFVRTLQLEEPSRRCAVVDVGSRPDDAAVVRELAAFGQHVEVVLRGNRRWTSDERAVALPPGVTGAVRRRGCYLVTGGFGALGLASARALADTGLEPTVVLMGRHDPTAAGTEEGAPGQAEALAALEDLTNRGATVVSVAGDVTERRALRRALDVATARGGGLHGVFHAAGVAGAGMIAGRQTDAVQAVLQAKLSGTVLLGELLAERPPLDFLTLFSSRAGSFGLVGSADYAAGNAFLDAWAAVSGLPFPVLSIGWPSWSGRGMAALGTQNPPEPRSSNGVRSNGVRPSDPDPRTWTVMLSPEASWVVGEHTVGDRPVMPGSGYVDLLATGLADPGQDNPPRKVVLHDVVFQRSLDAAHRLEVRCSVGMGEESPVSVESRRLGATDWTLNVTGRVRWADSRTPLVDLPALIARFSENEPGTLLDESRRDEGQVTVGPRWQSVVRLARRADEDLVELRLPDEYAGDVAEHVLHPALLDLATALLQRRNEPGHLPFMYRCIQVHEPLPAHFFSHIRRRPDRPGTLSGDIDLIALDGRVLVQIEAFTMRLADAGQLLQATQVASPTVGEREGIPPFAGGLLLLEALTSGRNGNLLVRPYRDGAPVELSGSAVRSTASHLDQMEVAAGTVSDPPPLLPFVVGAPATAPSEADSPAATVATQPPATADVTLVAGQSVVAEPEAKTPAGVLQGPALAQALLEVLIDVLGADDASMDDDFFNLGGNSLSAVQLMASIRERLDVDLSIGLLFEYPTVRQLATAVDATLRR